MKFATACSAPSCWAFAPGRRRPRPILAPGAGDHSVPAGGTLDTLGRAVAQKLQTSSASPS